MFQLKSILIFCLFLYVQRAPAAQNTPDLPGPIARATGFITSLVTLIVNYRGPIHDCRSGHSCIQGNYDAPWFKDQHYACPYNFFVFNRDFTIDFYRLYLHKTKGVMHIQAHQFQPDFSKGEEQLNSLDPQKLSKYQEEQILTQLHKQKFLTKEVRENHPEIPLPTDPHIAAQEINNKVIVATTGNTIELWPLEYGDFEPDPQLLIAHKAASKCAIS